MRFRLLPSLGLCLASGAFVVGARAQPPKTPASKTPARKAPVAPQATENGAVSVRGNQSLTDTETEISRLTGDVSVAQEGEDFILYAQSLVFNKPQNRALASQKLIVKTTDSTITGTRIDADFNTKTLTLFGQVKISTHGQGDGITGNRQKTAARGEFTSKPSKLTCDRVDWDYETRQAVLTGNIKMTQGKNSGTCKRIEFDERQNVARLMGNVTFIDDKGQSYATPDLTIYNNENRIVTGRSRLFFRPDANSGAQPRQPKAPVTAKKAPVITPDELGLFGARPAPIPALKPDAAPAPEPNPELPADETPATDPAR